MNREERQAFAVEMKTKGAYHCAQALVLALADLAGVDRETLLKAASPFGAGMGSTEATCGALIGAALVAGFATGGERSTRAARSILEKFRASCGAVTCKDLKRIVEGKPLCSCEECVRQAVAAYCDTFGLED